ncbi:hypothetical protein HOY80DRAFT_1058264 [Tuber brumale]|nr:hypothetical protein HOY80DRAFT_1058264 [Tuber brumale]
MSVHPSTLLVVQMANLATKKETMLNFLVVGNSATCTGSSTTTFNFASDDDFFSESDVVEFRPRKRTHINLEAPGNSDGRLLIRRHSPTENWWSTGPRQQSRTQVNLHKRLRTELAWQQPCSLEDISLSEPQTPSDSAAVMENMIKSAWSFALDQRKREKEEYYRSGDQRPAEQTPSTLPDAISLEMTVDLRDGPRTSWFTVEEIVKLMRSYFFANERSLGCKRYTQQYFSPLRWPTVLLVCTALRCFLMDYKDTGHKSLAVADFSPAMFGDYYKRYYQTYQKMSEARKNATIRKIEKMIWEIMCVTSSRVTKMPSKGLQTLPPSRHAPILREEWINAEQQGKELGP